MKDRRPRLLFVSTMFLYPVDTGARIRTTQILRGLKGGRFRVILASPATSRQLASYRDRMADLADEFHHWPVSESHRLFPVTRLRYLASGLPVPVATDRSAVGQAAVKALLDSGADVVVADFPHAMVLMPEKGVKPPIVLFTHNVEAEIFARHHAVARDPLRRWIWDNQRIKMTRYEHACLRRAAAVVAVADRDAVAFREQNGVTAVHVIPTGVDLDFHSYKPPAAGTSIVFTGSMDWLANIDGIEYLLREVWPLIVAREPAASMTVVGRSPPAALMAEARRRGYAWTFTGRVEDTRPYVWNATAFVIPLRVGGGTRLKVYEAMALGCPVVSTSIGVEGLPVSDRRNCLIADDPAGLARELLQVMADGPLRNQLSVAARQFVEEGFSYRRAAQVFEDACSSVLAGT